MAIFYISTPAGNAAANAVVDLLDAGAGPGTLKIYSGSMPADGDTTPPGTLLATVTLEDPAFGSAAALAAALADPDAVTISASGTAAVALWEDSDGNNVFVCDVGSGGDGAALQLATVALSSGGSLDITGFTYTQPDGT